MVSGPFVNKANMTRLQLKRLEKLEKIKANIIDEFPDDENIISPKDDNNK